MSRIFNTNVGNFQKADKNDKLFFKRMSEEKYSYNHTKYLVVDSRDRDRTKFPNVNNYTIQFNNGDDGNVSEQFRNVTQIELTHCILPTAVATDEPFLTLEIPELKPTLSGTNDNIDRSFATLIPEPKSATYAHCKNSYTFINQYNTPISSLNKLTFQFRRADGTLYDFGTDTSPPTAVDKAIQNQLFFKITCREPDFKPLEPILT